MCMWAFAIVDRTVVIILSVATAITIDIAAIGILLTVIITIIFHVVCVQIIGIPVLSLLLSEVYYHSQLILLLLSCSSYRRSSCYGCYLSLSRSYHHHAINCNFCCS